MSLKTTIMKMIKNELGIEVVDTPIDTREQTNESLLFIGYMDGSKNKLKVVNYNEYDLYGKNVVVSDLAVESVIIDNVQHKVVGYDDRNGILELEDEVHQLMPYEDRVDSVSSNREFILVTTPYSYTDRLSKILINYYHRYQFDLFLYDEVNEDRLDTIINKLHNLFSNDFPIDDTKNYAYIQSPLTIKRIEFLNTDKVIRGSILLRTDK